MYLVDLPMEIQELNVEITHHPDLILRLNEYKLENPEATLVDKIAVVAAYLNILLDGIYDHDAIMRLCTICTNKLRDKRGSLLIVSAGSNSLN